MSATDTTTWPDLAIGLYDRLTGRNAEITYEMENLKVAVPSWRLRPMRLSASLGVGMPC